MYPIPKVVPITELRNRQKELLAELQDGPILLTQHSRAAAMLVDPERWNELMGEIEDLTDIVAALEAKIELLSGRDDTVSLDELEAELSSVPARN